MVKKFSKLDTVLLVALIVVYTPLSLWGGTEGWGGNADILPLLMFVVGAAYVIFESIRLCSPAVCSILGALVPFFTIGPSLFFYQEDIGAFLVVILIGFIFGLLVSTLCWALKGKKKAPISE